MSQKRAATSRFVAEMCRSSFYQFFLEFWSVIAAEKLVDSWYIKRLCDELQVISERVFQGKNKDYDLIWNCPPGTSKSSIVSRLWQPWIWTRMPSARFISGSYSEKLALDLSRASRDVVQSDKYRELFPGIDLRDDLNAKGEFGNTRGGVRYATGVGGSILGRHAHFIAIDDPLDPQGAISDLILAEANTWMNEVLSRRKVSAMLTPTVLIMQRLHQNDPAGNRLEQKTPVRHCCIPVDLNWEVKPESFREFYEGGLLDAERLPQPALDEAYDILGEAGYACQMGQSPIPRGGAMFKVDRLHFRSDPPATWKRGPIRFWDKAGAKKGQMKGRAFTVGTKMALDRDDFLWILDVDRFQMDSGSREKRILQTARLDGKPVKVGVEQEPADAGEEAAEATVKMLTLAGFRAFMDRASGDKETRADPFSVYVNLGKVVILNAPWNKEYVQELRYFPRSKYKDQVDASSGCFANLVRRRLRVGSM